jgi:hypothetical protein
MKRLKGFPVHWAVHRYRQFLSSLQTIGLPVLETPVAPGGVQN